MKLRLSYDLVAALLLVMMFCIALFSSKGFLSDPGDSATMDEVAHIPSGYSYVKDFDYRLNPEHPPLVKALAGLPLLFKKNIIGPEGDASFEKDIDQWDAGWYMLYGGGNDPATILFWTRLPMMLLMVALGWFIYFWSRKLYGPKVGIFILAFFAFYPDIIAHGRLVTTDVAAALGFVTAIYFYNQAICKTCTKTVLLAAVFFAVAQLLKFSTVLLFFIFIILAIARPLIARQDIPKFRLMLKQNLKTYFLISILSLIFVWLAYIPFVWNTIPEIEHQVIENNLKPNDSRTEPIRKVFHKLEKNLVTRAIGHHALGVSLVFSRVEGGNKTFILGHSSDKGIWWYFPVAWLIKTPIPIIILLFTTFAFILVKRKSMSKDQKWLLVLLLTPIVIYWASALQGSLNLGIRHLMPTVPFALLIIGVLLKHLFEKKMIWQVSLVYLLLGFTVYSTLASFPNYISYFNEFVPKNQRYRYMIDSSLDWGQDLLRLKKYVEENNINNIKIDYFGGSRPSYYLPSASSIQAKDGPTDGVLAISATFYQSSKIHGPKEKTWSYSWLDGYEPKTIIGGSILVFDISKDDLKNNPPDRPAYLEKEN